METSVHKCGNNNVKSDDGKAKVKRSFDVAFLMLPDEKLKQKNVKREEFAYNNNEEEEDGVSEEIEIEDDDDVKAATPISEYKKFCTQKQQIFDDPTLLVQKDQKSAFTKVRDTRNLSLSPDLPYQSPSPPIARYNYIFKNHQQPPYHNGHFLTENYPQTAPDLLQKQFRPIYQQNYNYQPLGSVPAEIRSNPATAAILTTLLPPSLAALSLPAQNVCAKCNVSFRMTSDLVYHMRSHHKNEAGDVNKRRREEKLKCPVCQESFRERHHLTRHMTAHQDKDDDEKNEKKF